MTAVHPAPDDTSSHPAPPTPSRPSRLRRLLWLVLVLAACANLVTAAVLQDPVASSACGSVVLACAVALTVMTVRARRARSGGA
jgi:hypothetical protein